MVTLKEYEAYLKVKRFIDGRDEAEIISGLIKESNYVPLIIESDGINPIKYYSISAAAKYCGVTKQTLDYAYRNRCTRIVRRKGGGKEEELKNLELSGWINFIWGVINLNVLWDLRFAGILGFVGSPGTLEERDSKLWVLVEDY